MGWGTVSRFCPGAAVWTVTGPKELVILPEPNVKLRDRANGEEPRMLDRITKAEEFIERFRLGEFNDRLEEALDSLTPEQREELLNALEYMPEDLTRSGSSN